MKLQFYLLKASISNKRNHSAHHIGRENFISLIKRSKMQLNISHYKITMSMTILMAFDRIDAHIINDGNSLLIANQIHSCVECIYWDFNKFRILCA